MSKLAIFVSATIVLIFSAGIANANPEKVIPDTKQPQESPWPSSEPDENLAITDPPPVSGSPKGSRARYYPYRQALTFRAGKADDHTRVDLANMDEMVLGFQYLFPKFLSPKLEAGVDLVEDGKGHIHAGSRWIFWERSYFRPSIKLSLDHLADSKEKLATLTKIDNYFARASLTLEYVIWNPLSIRLEPEWLVNLEGSMYMITVGLSHGW